MAEQPFSWEETMAATALFGELDRVRRNWGWFLALGIALIVLGIIALWVSFLATIISVLVLGWILIIGGVLQIISSFGARDGAGGIFLHLLTGILALVVGWLLVVNPGTGAIALTLLLATFFLVSGAFRVIAALALRFPNWGWGVLGGVITFILGAMVWAHWPSSGLWFIGLAVGVDMIFHGWAWVMFALAVRNLPRPA
jgi:uncharacterized membrane protein HdeD (DUF308 family)